MQNPKVVTWADELEMRKERITTLKMAIEDCHVADAADICVHYLEHIAAAAPEYRPFEDLTSQAQLWASCAHNAELALYLVAIAREIADRDVPIQTWRFVLAGIWQALPPDEKRFFAAWVKGGSGK